MQVTITCRHGQLSDSAHEYIREKAEKLLDYFERITAITVTIDHDGHLGNTDRIRAEILVDAEHKHDFVARAEDERATTAFDLALHKMEQQLRRYKEKLTDHHRGKSIRQMERPAE